MKTKEVTKHDTSNAVFHLQLENLTYNVEGITIYF